VSNLPISELERKLPLVSYRSRRSAGSQLDVRLVLAVRHCQRNERILWFLARSRSPHHQSIRRWILHRSAALGTTLGSLRSSTSFHWDIHRVYRFPNRMCPLEKHGVDSDIPVLGWMLCCGPFDEFRCLDCGYLGYGSPRTGHEYLFACTVCGTIDWAHCCGLHIRHWHSKSMHTLI